MAIKRKDLTGMVVGRLTVLHYAYSNKYAYWKCRCECGNETFVRSSHLIAGLVRSCGCLNSEIGKRTIKYAHAKNFKHGDSRSRLHIIWTNIIQRCHDKNSKSFIYYGGRGIGICPEWHDFIVFRDWALVNGYKDDLTIDRINVNGNYEPLNCRWVGRDIQANNKRNNVFIIFREERRTVAQWAKEYDIPITTFLRWYKKGEKIEDILLKKCGKYKTKQHLCTVCGKQFGSHSHKSKYCSLECRRISENEAQLIKRRSKICSGRIAV